MNRPNRFFFVDDLEPAELCPVGFGHGLYSGFGRIPEQWCVVVYTGGPDVFNVFPGGRYFGPALDELQRRLNAEEFIDQPTADGI